MRPAPTSPATFSNRAAGLSFPAGSETRAVAVGVCGCDFRRADEDGSGELDAEEFREALAQFGFEDKDEQDAMFREIDADGGGTVSWDEFLRWWRGEDDWENEDEQEGEGEH